MNTFDKLTFKLLLATTIHVKEDSYVVNEIFSRFPSVQELLEVIKENYTSWTKTYTLFTFI